MQTQMSDQILEPQKGSKEDCIERVIDFVGQFDTKWSKLIKPAQKEKIGEMKNILKLDNKEINLLSVYFQYMERMGEYDGGLISDTLYGDCCIDSLLELYKEYAHEEIDIIKNGFINFCMQDMGGQYSIMFGKSDDEQVYETDDEIICSPIAENFEKLLFQCAVKKFAFFETSFKFAGSKSGLIDALGTDEHYIFLKQIRVLCKKYGMEEAWISDFKHYISFGDNLIVWIEVSEGINGRVTGKKYDVVTTFLSDLKKISGYSFCQVENVSKNNLLDV